MRFLIWLALAGAALGQSTLVERLDLSASQLVRLAQIREEFNRFHAEKAERYRQVSRELEEEKLREPLNRLMMGQQRVEQEAICRELRAASASAVARNTEVLSPAQRARLEQIVSTARLLQDADRAHFLGPLPTPPEDRPGVCSIAPLAALKISGYEQAFVNWQIPARGPAALVSSALVAHLQLTEGQVASISTPVLRSMLLVPFGLSVELRQPSPNPHVVGEFVGAGSGDLPARLLRREGPSRTQPITTVAGAAAEAVGLGRGEGTSAIADRCIAGRVDAGGSAV